MIDHHVLEVALQLLAALLADRQIFTVLPLAIRSWAFARASFAIDELKPPQRPRSAS